MTIQENISLLPYHTFHIPARCRRFIEYNSVEELQQLLQSDFLKKEPFLHIGAGSNLLFCKDFDGSILHSAIRFHEVVSETDSDIIVRVGAGVVWDDFVAWCVKNGWYGVENLSHIPGEVGASAIQNVGAYGVEAKDVIEQVECVQVLDGKPVIFRQEECRYGYRSSLFKHDWKGKYMVTAVLFRLSKIENYRTDYGNLSEKLAQYEPINLDVVRNVIIEVRKEKLPEPEELGSAGSFFMNPVIPDVLYNRLLVDYPHMPGYKAGEGLIKVPAAWLIDQCRWKGKSYGGATVYEKQCLVLVNQNNATAADVVALAEQIAQSVYKKFCITIVPEVNYIS